MILDYFLLVFYIVFLSNNTLLGIALFICFWFSISILADRLILCVGLVYACDCAQTFSSHRHKLCSKSKIKYSFSLFLEYYIFPLTFTPALSSYIMILRSQNYFNQIKIKTSEPMPGAVEPLPQVSQITVMYWYIVILLYT